MTKHLYDEIAKRWYRGGSIYVYSDLHLSDKDCYNHRFPGVELTKEKIEELDNMQINNINKVCRAVDTLIILGDVGNVECIKKLKSNYKILIMGNHDSGASNYKRKVSIVRKCPKCGCTELIDLGNNDGMSLYKTQCTKCHFTGFTLGSDFDYTEDNHLFDEVYEGPLQISTKIVLSHEPFEHPYCLNIHGHVHFAHPLGAYTEGVNCGSHYNCCAEQINYKPVSLKWICESGMLKTVKDIHRATIDTAIIRKERGEDRYD